jgi:hypothetical protein
MVRSTLRTSPQGPWRLCALPCSHRTPTSHKHHSPLCPPALSPLAIPRTCPYLTCPISFEKNMKPSIRARKWPAWPDAAAILLARQPPRDHQPECGDSGGDRPARVCYRAAAPAPRDPNVWCLAMARRLIHKEHGEREATAAVSERIWQKLVTMCDGSWGCTPGTRVTARSISVLRHGRPTATLRAALSVRGVARWTLIYAPETTR